MQEHRGMATAQLPLNVKKIRFSSEDCSMSSVEKDLGRHCGMCLDKAM